MNWELKLLVIRNKKEIYLKKNSFIKYVKIKKLYLNIFIFIERKKKSDLFK